MLAVTPYVGVWIETFRRSMLRIVLLSHPTWVCGLKLKNVEYGKEKAMSHPTWVCGLKQAMMLLRLISSVTPYVGVWIETCTFPLVREIVISHTLRGCVD